MFEFNYKYKAKTQFEKLYLTDQYVYYIKKRPTYLSKFQNSQFDDLYSLF